MKFYQRFAYYLVGFSIGMFIVVVVWSGKDTRCNYFPNARVLNDIRNKPFHYDIEASRRLSEDWVDTIDIKNTLQYGDVDFDKSNIKTEGGKLYIIYGKTTKKQDITLEIINYPEKAVLRNIIKENKK
ncbi:hypothetical protein GCM10011508_13650 [Flavobacterium lutivivi]|jgi:hypothetical protein|nr:hypothetical protein GCM10011508_13650 [Flavobacterium lutivivi]HRG17746.1 DUF4258 domain-containing protein [Flavobacterium lutivivi]